MYETKYLTEEQKRKYIRAKEELTKQATDDSKIKYVCSDLMEKIIKSCRRVKQCNAGVNRLEKEKQRENFSECNWTRTHNHLVHKRTLKFVHKRTL